MLNRLPHAGDLLPEIVDESQEAEDDTPSCSLADALDKQSLFVNRGVSLYALNLLWELFRYGQIAYHGVFVNLKNARTTPLPVDPAAWSRFGYPKPVRSRKRKGQGR
jgi:PRTRC genetic system ThiF family protein